MFRSDGLVDGKKQVYEGYGTNVVARIKGWAYNAKEDFENASAAYFEVTGSHGRGKSNRSDRVYLVLDGEGEFDIDGKTAKVTKTDVVIVPKNTPYDYKATNEMMKLFLVHTPSYDPDFEVQIDA